MATGMVLGRRILVIGSIATVTACSASASHIPPSTPGASRHAGGSPTSIGQTTSSPSLEAQAVPGPCSAATLRLRSGPRVSGATGEHGVILAAIDVSTVPCTVTGYPTITFVDTTGSPIPFTYANGAGEYVTHRGPQAVTIGDGRVAYFLVAKYRCDTGYTKSATGATVRLPGQGTIYSVPTTWLVNSFSFCTGGASPDPGNTVTISPFEAATNLLGNV